MIWFLSGLTSTLIEFTSSDFELVRMFAENACPCCCASLKSHVAKIEQKNWSQFRHNADGEWWMLLKWFKIKTSIQSGACIKLKNSTFYDSLTEGCLSGLWRYSKSPDSLTKEEMQSGITGQWETNYKTSENLECSGVSGLTAIEAVTLWETKTKKN